MKTTTLVLLSAVLLTACASEDDGSTTLARDGQLAEAPAPATDWKATALERAERARTADPARFSAASTMQPIVTRKGTLRFVGDAVRHPAAADVLLGRLAAGEDDPMLRAALVDALPRTGGDYGAELLAMLGEETDADVRVVMVGALERADAPSARAGLAVALDDDDPIVRTEAARVTGMRTDGAALAGELEAALDDETPQVRAAAARTLGVLEVDGAKDALLPALEDTNPDVRLQSLRALGRIDPAFAAALPQLSKLEADDDARVVRAAEQLSAR